MKENLKSLISPSREGHVALWAGDLRPPLLILFELDHRVPGANSGSVLTHILPLWIKQLTLGDPSSLGCEMMIEIPYHSQGSSEEKPRGAQRAWLWIGQRMSPSHNP